MPDDTVIQPHADHQLRSLLDRVRERFEVPGIAAAIVGLSGEREASSGLSSVGSGIPITANDRVPISCVMKVLVSWLVLHAESVGRIGLDEDVAVYVPQVLGVAGKMSGIKVRHLLTHTAGYVEPQENSARWGYSLDRFLSFFPERKQAFRPGSLWSYTHSGHALLALALERVSGRSVDDLLRELLFDPLGIELRYLGSERAAGARAVALHVKNPKSGTYAAMRPPRETGFLRYSISDAMLSAREMATLGSAFAGGCQARLAHLEEARSRLLSAATPVPPYLYGPEGEQMPRAFCHGLADYGPVKGINGSYVGSTCAIRLDECSGAGLAVVVNAYEPHVRDVVTRALTSALFGTHRTEARRGGLAQPWDDMAGRYEGLMLGSEDAAIEWNGSGFQCTVRFKRGPSMTCRVEPGKDGELKLIGGSRNLAVGFARESDTGEPYLMVTTSAFRRC